MPGHILGDYWGLGVIKVLVRITCLGEFRYSTGLVALAELTEFTSVSVFTELVAFTGFTAFRVWTVLAEFAKLSRI